MQQTKCPYCGAEGCARLIRTSAMLMYSFVRCLWCGWYYRVESWVMGVRFGGTYDEPAWRR